MFEFHMCHWAWHVKRGAHLLSLPCLNLPQLWRESSTHMLLGEVREFSAHLIEGDFDSGTFCNTSRCNNHFTTGFHEGNFIFTYHANRQLPNLREELYQYMAMSYQYAVWAGFPTGFNIADIESQNAAQFWSIVLYKFGIVYGSCFMPFIHGRCTKKVFKADFATQNQCLMLNLVA